MTDATRDRLNKFVGPYPARGSILMAAGVLAIRNTFAVRTDDGYGSPPVAGYPYPAIGFWSAEFDNRTTAPEGGAAGAITGEYLYGVAEFEIDGDTPLPFQRVYVVDNQTVSLDDNDGLRGVAGIVTEVRNGKAFVYVGPVACAPFAAFESLDLGAFRLNTGAALAAYSVGVNDGIAISEGVQYVWEANPVAADTIWSGLALPADVDLTLPISVMLLVSRTGTNDEVPVTVGAYLHQEGEAITATTDIGGSTAASTAATTLTDLLTYDLDPADYPAAPRLLSLSLLPGAALDADIFNLHAVGVAYVRK